MHPDCGGVNHHVSIVRVIQQHLEYPLPDPGPSPAGETLVDAFPVTELCWQILPLGAAAQDREHAVNEGPIIFGRYADPALTTVQEPLNQVPLSGA